MKASVELSQDAPIRNEPPEVTKGSASSKAYLVSAASSWGAARAPPGPECDRTRPCQREALTPSPSWTPPSMGDAKATITPTNSGFSKWAERNPGLAQRIKHGITTRISPRWHGAAASPHSARQVAGLPQLAIGRRPAGVRGRCRTDRRRRLDPTGGPTPADRRARILGMGRGRQHRQIAPRCHLKPPPPMLSRQLPPEWEDAWGASHPRCERCLERFSSSLPA